MTTVDELKKQAADAMDGAVKSLLESGEVSMSLQLVPAPNETGEFIVLSSDVTNNEEAKKAIFAAVRAKVAAGRFQAVISVSDTYFSTDLTPQANKLRLQFNMTIEQAASAGLCTKRESVVVILESPLYSQIDNQRYRREGDTVVLEERMTSEASIGGRLHFFPNKLP